MQNGLQVDSGLSMLGIWCGGIRGPVSSEGGRQYRKAENSVDWWRDQKSMQKPYDQRSGPGHEE